MFKAKFELDFFVSQMIHGELFIFIYFIYIQIRERNIFQREIFFKTAILCVLFVACLYACLVCMTYFECVILEMTSQ